jgi:hypothetical protein
VASISTRAYCYSSEQACALALRKVQEELAIHGQCDRVIDCDFGDHEFSM